VSSASFSASSALICAIRGDRYGVSSSGFVHSDLGRSLCCKLSWVARRRRYMRS